jgi:hypothetical protein
MRRLLTYLALPFVLLATGVLDKFADRQYARAERMRRPYPTTARESWQLWLDSYRSSL